MCCNVDEDVADSDGVSEDELSGSELQGASSDEEKEDKDLVDEGGEEISEQVEVKKGRNVTEKMVKRWKSGLEVIYCLKYLLK